MKSGSWRRLEHLERSLEGLGVHAGKGLSDAELIQRLTDRTATPADLRQVYEICAPDLEIRLFQEGTKRRLLPHLDYRERTAYLQPFDEAAELLRYRADEEIGFKLVEKPPFDPSWWVEDERRPSPHRRSFSPYAFTIWAHATLVAHLLDHDPLAIEFRRRLDTWFDSGEPPVDFLRYPEPREYLLLNPRNHPSNNCFDIPMLRYPHEALYESIDWGSAEPSFGGDGHRWTRVDSLGRSVVSVQVIPQFSGLAFKLSSTPAFT